MSATFLRKPATVCSGKWPPINKPSLDSRCCYYMLGMACSEKWPFLRHPVIISRLQCFSLTSGLLSKQDQLRPFRPPWKLTWHDAHARLSWLQPATGSRVQWLASPSLFFYPHKEHVFIPGIEPLSRCNLLMLSLPICLPMFSQFPDTDHNRLYDHSGPSNILDSSGHLLHSHLRSYNAIRHHQGYLNIVSDTHLFSPGRFVGFRTQFVLCSRAHGHMHDRNPLWTPLQLL
jgi:hypothetical protein